jgi:EcsC protein family
MRAKENAMTTRRQLRERFFDLTQALFKELDQDSIRGDVKELRSKYPEATRRELAHRLARKAAMRTAAVGAAAGAIGGVFAILAMAPDILNLVREQSRLVLGIAFIYDEEPNLPDRFREVLAVLAFSTGTAAAKEGAVWLVSRAFEEEAAQKLARRIAGRYIARKLPEIAPAIGGAIGAVINALAIRAVEKAAVEFYRKAEGRRLKAEG